MRVIPVMHCRDMTQSLSFYTRILDFEHVGTWPPKGSPSYSVIKKEDIEINLSTHRGDGVAGNVVIIEVQNIDNLFKTYLAKGIGYVAKKRISCSPGTIGPNVGPSGILRDRSFRKYIAI